MDHLCSARRGSHFGGLVRAKWKDNRLYARPDCVACPIKYVCGGGCRIDSLERHGDIPACAALCVMMGAMFHVYVLRCSDGSLYIGQTNDLDRRLRDHSRGRVRWTKSRLPIELLKSKAFHTRAEAVNCERRLKSGYGRKWIKDHLL